EVLRLRVAQPDDAEERVVGRVGDGDGVRELLRSVDPVAVAHRDVRGGGRTGGLACEAGRRSRDQGGQQDSGGQNTSRARFHVRCPGQGEVSTSASLAKSGWVPGSKGAAARRLPCAWRRSLAAG